MQAAAAFRGVGPQHKLARTQNEGAARAQSVPEKLLVCSRCVLLGSFLLLAVLLSRHIDTLA